MLVEIFKKGSPEVFLFEERFIILSLGTFFLSISDNVFLEWYSNQHSIILIRFSVQKNFTRVEQLPLMFGIDIFNFFRSDVLSLL